jgi:hypothetical protein
MIIWLFWLRLRLIASTLISSAIIISSSIKPMCIFCGSTSKSSERPRHRCLGVVEKVVVYNHLDKRDHTGCPVVRGGDGGASTVISILSDAVRPVESVTVRSTLYVPAWSNVCSTVSSSSLSSLPSPKSQL